MRTSLMCDLKLASNNEMIGMQKDLIDYFTKHNDTKIN